MNSADQAQKGFKTFILTLSVSLIFFSAVYYLLNTVLPKPDIISSDSMGNYGQDSNLAQNQGEVSGAQDSDDVLAANTESEDLVSTKDGNPDDQVAGETPREAVGDAIGGVGNQIAEDIDEEPSAFADLVAQKVDVKSKAVLAGATQTTQTTVPATGFTGITGGLIISTIVFLGTIAFLYSDPRRKALMDFERKISG